jgi:hypothetical protein
MKQQLLFCSMIWGHNDCEYCVSMLVTLVAREGEQGDRRTTLHFVYSMKSPSLRVAPSWNVHARQSCSEGMCSSRLLTQIELEVVALGVLQERARSSISRERPFALLKVVEAEWQVSLARMQPAIDE